MLAYARAPARSLISGDDGEEVKDDIGGSAANVVVEVTTFKVISYMMLFAPTMVGQRCLIGRWASISRPLGMER